MEKKKLTFEYLINTTPGSLFRFISSEAGLKEWFADDVLVSDQQYTFFWGKVPNVAYLLESRLNDAVRFQWEEDQDTPYYFELSISTLELTGDTALMITDYAEPGNEDDLKQLWDNGVKKLKRRLGLL